MYNSVPQFEALAFLAAAFSLIAIAACVKIDGTLQRMKRAVNKLERHLGWVETKEMRFKEFREMLRNIEEEYERKRNGDIDWKEDEDNDNWD